MSYLTLFPCVFYIDSFSYAIADSVDSPASIFSAIGVQSRDFSNENMKRNWDSFSREAVQVISIPKIAIFSVFSADIGKNLVLSYPLFLTTDRRRIRQCTRITRRRLGGKFIFQLKRLGGAVRTSGLRRIL
jgi:hypothetical protein